jgi:hypothetical protein
MLTVISLGAGVQSTTIALMAAIGEIKPTPDCAIFADTKAEPAEVYRHLDWLESELPFPIFRVSAGDLRAQVKSAMRGEMRMDGRPPFFTATGGMLRRQCTHDFKIRPITAKIRELLGLKKGARGPRTPVAQQWIGISSDELLRIKPSRFSYIEHRWPLVEKGMSRAACVEWCVENGYPTPPKSACTFCPFRDDAAWLAMKTHDPESFADAVAIDEAIRPGVPGLNRPLGERWFVHRKRRPLSTVEFSAQSNDVDPLTNECDGVCGV